MQPQFTTRDCAVCGTPFRLYPSTIETARYCSRPCMYQGRTPPLLNRLWANIVKIDDATSCWLWQGVPDHDGYGQIKDHGKKLRPHRIALEIQLGRPLQMGMGSLHKCDVPLCCRNDGAQSHLFEGTTRDNIDDMVAKGRGLSGNRNPVRLNPSIVQGERNGNARLGPAQVREMRELAAAGVTRTILARRYGISISLASQIVLRKAWRSVL